MNNVLLGKTVKAMYKLSGKTLSQLADETGLTVDTINNLFYARLQKPGFMGVCSLVKAMGCSVRDLTEFMEKAQTLPAEADFTEEFTKYLASAEVTVQSVAPAKEIHDGQEILQEQLCAQYRTQIEQQRLSYEQMQEHYSRSITEIKKSHAEELERQEQLIRHLKKSNMTLTAAVVLMAVLTVAAMLILKVQ